jgi:ATP synthase protein I
MNDRKQGTRLSNLGDRLVSLRGRTRQKDAGGIVTLGDSRGAAMGFAVRAGIGVVTSVICGGGLGWLIDHWLGTLPLFLMIFFFLGAGAGLFNIFWAAKHFNGDPGHLET